VPKSDAYPPMVLPGSRRLILHRRLILSVLLTQVRGVPGISVPVRIDEASRTDCYIDEINRTDAAVGSV